MYQCVSGYDAPNTVLNVSFNNIINYGLEMSNQVNLQRRHTPRRFRVQGLANISVIMYLVTSWLFYYAQCSTIVFPVEVSESYFHL